MNQEKALNLILAVVVLLLAGKEVVLAIRKPAATMAVQAAVAAPTSQESAGEAVLRTIMTRASVRSYTGAAIADAQLERLVRAGMAAPTARNRQPWKFVVLNQREVLDGLGERLPYAKMLKQAPAAIVVCGDLKVAFPEQPAQEYWVQDCSAATQNILLAAHALGLGAVWTGVYPIAERVADVRTELRLPENLMPLAVIVIGHPAGETLPKDKWKPENLHWNRF